MRYIKEYNGGEEDLYRVCRDYNSVVGNRISISIGEMLRINRMTGLNCDQSSMPGDIYFTRNDMEYNGRIINISKYDDDYYVVRFIRKVNGLRVYYLCDGFDGLMEFIKDRVWEK